MKSLRVLATKIVNLLEAGSEIPAVYPLLVQAEPLRQKLYRNHPGPHFSLNYDGNGWWRLETNIPQADYHHIADWHESKPLTIEESQELRTHIIGIVKAWLAEDDLYGPPMERQYAARLFTNGKGDPITVKTLSRRIKSGALSAIEVGGKNMIRVLKTHIPQE